MFWQRLLFWRKHRERDIFTFWDGQKNRSIDPMPAWFAIEEDPECNCKRDFKAADRGNRESWNKVLAMIRRMFDVKPLSEGGLTECETQKLFADFYDFCMRLKKKQDGFRTSWESSVGVPPEESTTPPDAESGSTPNESGSEEPSRSSPPSSQQQGT